MPRGGARPNAGRKPGSVEGDKTKSTKVKARSLAAKTLHIARKAAMEGQTPLEYMLQVMRNSTDQRRKDAMAIAAAPYIHPRLQAVELKGDPDNPIVTQNVSDVDRPGRESREEFIARRQSELGSDNNPTQH